MKYGLIAKFIEASFQRRPFAILLYEGCRFFALCKFAKKEGCEEMTKHLCKMDDSPSDPQGTVLDRMKHRLMGMRSTIFMS